jgi:ribosome hibernation promoting factor
LKAFLEATSDLAFLSSHFGHKETIVQVKITARHGHLSEAAQQHIRDKAEKLLHYFGRIMMIEVLVDMKENECVVEFLVSAEHKHDFVASERNKDLLAAVDLVLDKLEGQVRKYKEKIQDHRRTPPTGHVAGAASSEETGEEE